MIEIREATKNQAAEIASLIMTAMTDDCCLYFCGEGDGLEDLASGRACSHSAEQASLRRSRLLAAFRKMMTMLVEREDSQYSYRNTLVAMEGLSAFPSAMMVGFCMNFGEPLSRLPKNISARIILAWMMRRRLANCILILWPCFQNIVVRALPESCCWLPRNGPIVWGCHVSDYW